MEPKILIGHPSIVLPERSSFESLVRLLDLCELRRRVSECTEAIDGALCEFKRLEKRWDFGDVNRCYPSAPIGHYFN
ncbi:hypothetical protein NKH28_31955 [Mesorhizobium sp. M1227]